MTQPAIPAAWLDTRATAAYLSVTPRQLEAWRSKGNGPPYSKWGRCVRYNILLVEQWMKSRMQASTADNGGAR